jgi:hypothetical protein
MRLNNLLASSVLILLAGSLSACSQSGHNTSAGVQTGQEGVNYQETAEQTSTNMTPEENKSALKNLQTGQPLSYYGNEFNRLGFSVAHSASMNDQHTYDLRKGTERYMVTLTTPDNQDQVNRVDVRELRTIGIANPTKDTSQEVAATIKDIQSLQTGKKPYEYIPAIASKYGDVKEYSSNDKKAEIEFENSKNHYYQVHFTLNPTNQRVSDIKVDQNVWTSL